MNARSAARFLALPVLLTSLLAAAACVGSSSASDATRTRLASARPDVASLRTDVVWLADDAREGRRAGTAGERAAAEYIAQRFAALGLEPAGEDGTYFQRFEVSLPARDGGSSSLVAHRDSGPVTIEGADALVPLFCSDGGPVRGRAWFAGYGIVNEDVAWDDYAGQDLAGGIAFVVRGTPPESALPERAATDDEEEGVTKGHGWGNSGSIFHKVMTAKRHGAAGVVLVQHPDEEGEPLLAFDAAQMGRAGIPCAMISSKAVEELFLVGILSAASPRGVDPDHEYPAVRWEAGTFRELLESSGRFGECLLGMMGDPVDVTLTSDVIRESALATNVLARRRGARSDRTVVVGAHFDHLGHGGEGSLAPDAQGEIHNGADDNASGTACVLELARLYAPDPPPAGDVVFALWSGEELGLLGSEHWIRNPTFDLGEVRSNLNLDMVGRCDDGSLAVIGAGTADAFTGWMEEAAELSDLELGVSASGQGAGGSDHQTFLRREIPALHLFSGTHPDYHKPSDDSDKIELDGMRRVVLLCLDLIGRMHAERSLAFAEVAEEEQPAARRRTNGARFGSVPSYIPDPRGLVLDGTSPGGPAEAAGLLGGDVLTEVGSIAIGTIHDFVYALQTYKPGDVVRVRFLRDGELLETRVTLTSSQQE